MDRLQLKTGTKIPHSGIYMVRHRQHRLPHEVTLLKDETFPPCSKCDEAVQFELVMGVQDAALMPFRVVLHHIPVMEEEPAQAEAEEKAS